MRGTQNEKRGRKARLKKTVVFMVGLLIVVPLTACIVLWARVYQLNEACEVLRTTQKEVLLNNYSLQGQIEQAQQRIRELEAFPQMIYPIPVEVPVEIPVEVPTKRVEQDVDYAPEEIREVYLTFDDGPSSNTGKILDILKQYNVKATFFVVGKAEAQFIPLYKRIVEEGHTLGMHSYSHKYNEIYRSVDAYAEDFVKLRNFLIDTTGVDCKFARFPGGSSNSVSSVNMKELITYLDEQGVTYFDWNISSGDAGSYYISPERIISNCTANLKEYQTVVILLHDAAEKRSTVEALPKLIENIQAVENTVLLPISEKTTLVQHIQNEREE